MRYLPLIAIAMALALAAATPAGAAGSADFAVSLCQCSEVHWGGQKVGDNCITARVDEERYEAKLEAVESVVDDPENGDD